MAIYPRIYTAHQLRLEVGLSEESVGKLIELSKSIVKTYLNYTGSHLTDVDYYKSAKHPYNTKEITSLAQVHQKTLYVHQLIYQYNTRQG